MKRNKFMLSVIIVTIMLVVFAIVLVAVIQKNRRDLTQKEEIKILEELYFDARAAYLEVEFEYKEESEIVKCKNIKDEELELECYEIINYNEIMDEIFTENGKKQYKEKRDIRENGNGLIYIDEKVYGGMLGYSGDITYETTEFIDIEIESNTISCIARNIYSDGRDNIESKFIIKNVDGQWLVEEYSDEW